MKSVLFTLLLMMISSSVFADAHVWYDKYAGIDKIKKVVVFPVVGTKNIVGVEDVWKDFLTKRVKGTYFTLLQPENTQMSLIMEANTEYEKLLKTFSSEQDRAKAVKDITGADAYLVCKIRDNSVQRDWSPEKTCYVTIDEYTVESGGPDGYKKYNESSHEERFVVEGQYVYLHLLNLEYCLYNTSGQKIMLMNNQLQEYGTSEKDQFEDLLKEFAKELQKAKKNVGK